MIEFSNITVSDNHEPFVIAEGELTMMEILLKPLN